MPCIPVVYYHIKLSTWKRTVHAWVSYIPSCRPCEASASSWPWWSGRCPLLPPPWLSPPHTLQQWTHQCGTCRHWQNGGCGRSNNNWSYWIHQYKTDKTATNDWVMMQHCHIANVSCSQSLVSYFSYFLSVATYANASPLPIYLYVSFSLVKKSVTKLNDSHYLQWK